MRDPPPLPEQLQTVRERADHQHQAEQGGARRVIGLAHVDTRDTKGEAQADEGQGKKQGWHGAVEKNGNDHHGSRRKRLR